MARYKRISMGSGLVPVDLDAQLAPGSFAHALHHLVDRLELSAFDARHRNHESGASAVEPVQQGSVKFKRSFAPSP